MWERIDRWHLRMSVPGGWIVEWRMMAYRTDHYGDEKVVPGACNASLAFVPDPEHTWELPKKEAKD